MNQLSAIIDLQIIKISTRKRDASEIDFVLGVHLDADPWGTEESVNETRKPIISRFSLLSSCLFWHQVKCWITFL